MDDIDARCTFLGYKLGFDVQPSELESGKVIFFMTATGITDLGARRLHDVARALDAAVWADGYLAVPVEKLSQIKLERSEPIDSIAAKLDKAGTPVWFLTSLDGTDDIENPW
jgi:hypothetical protein